MMADASNPRVAFVAPQALPLVSGQGGGCGGAERQFFLFARHLRQRGIEVAFITDRGGQPVTQPIFPLIQTPFAYLGGSKWRLPLNWLQLWRAAYRSRATHLVLKTPAHLLVPLGLFCRLFGCRLVFWAQTSRDTDSHRLGLRSSASLLQNIGLRWAHTVITQTRDQKAAFERHFGRPAHGVASICDDLIEEVMALAGASDSTEPVDVLWAGNDSHNKQGRLFIDLARRRPDFRFAMALNRSDTDRFADLATRARGVLNLQFLGQVPPAEMERWFGRARLLVNTSLREGFPNTFLQAWQRGRPVISLHIDPDRIITRHGLGTLVCPDPQGPHPGAALADSVTRYLTNPTLYHQTGTRCRTYVENHHAPRVVVPQLIRALFKDPQSLH